MPPKSAPKKTYRCPSSQRNERDDDGGALKLGVESSWTRDDASVTGVEWSDSQWAEPPTSDQLTNENVDRALGAPVEMSTPLENVGDEGEGSTFMSISPLLGSVAGQPSPILFSSINRLSQNNNHTSDMRSPIIWSDLVDDEEDIGEVPEFPVLEPSNISSYGDSAQ
ncbi:hypothetical protein DEU56DRAFT_908436 [Suillus clintonianus]|uniref:uncharacterized protein n=1 Tax=Suillus clintonianus TaxID=1904413 RepID=UPI001B8770A4|nr:uncharacterized protein DEU56DRAFT_908436 [Suillus clintonianus]KAG2150797.1 hypothetical protein DEU56DRAFT_908436 [Suillus clintonianus]